MQQVFGILIGREQDSHWQTLYYLDVVTGGIFGWQQAEAIATGAGQILDVATIVLAVSINSNSHWLATAHTCELSFLEVCGYPDVIGLSHVHERLPGLDAGVHFDGTLADDSVRRCVDLRVAEVEHRLIESRLSCIRVGLARGDRLQHRGGLFARGVNFGRVNAGGRGILVVLLLRYDLLTEERGVTARVALRPVVAGFGLADNC